MELKKLKIKKIKLLESTKVHDISVQDVQHYITENGVINHNSGREYGASICLMITKAKLKNAAKEQTGIILTAKPKKNRFARPNTVKTHLDYEEGLNRFVGLQDYIEYDWDETGIERGEILDEKQLKKANAQKRGKAIEFEFKYKDEKSDEEKTKTLYFVGSKTSKTIAVKHLGRHLTSKEFFSEEFFTKEMLDSINEIIKPEFNYGIQDELPDEELFNLDDDE